MTGWKLCGKKLLLFAKCVTWIRAKTRFRACWCYTACLWGFHTFTDRTIHESSVLSPASPCIHRAGIRRVVLGGDAGANTDDPGEMTRDGPCYDPWMSESHFKKLKRMFTSIKRPVTVVMRAGTPRIKIRDDSVVRSLNVWKALLRHQQKIITLKFNFLRNLLDVLLLFLKQRKKGAFKYTFCMSFFCIF